MNKPRIGPLLRHALTRSALRAAWEKVADNQGAAGSDGERIGDIARQLDDVLTNLARSVVAGHYQPEPLRRVWLARPGKTPRGLAIPAVRDRILQTSVTLALTPRVENELEDCSFAYRQGRGVRQAAERINYYQRQGYRWVVDADIESFFDTIPHAALLTRLEALVPEAALIELVAQWLTAEIIDQGRCHRPRQGIPQGSPISPLLANLYLDTLDEALLDANHVLVRYADDFVVLAKTRERAEQALELTRDVLERIALRLNPIKTRIVNLEQGLEFLGWHFVRSLSLPKTWREDGLPGDGPLILATPPDATPNAMQLALQEALQQAGRPTLDLLKEAAAELPPSQTAENLPIASENAEISRPTAGNPPFSPDPPSVGIPPPANDPAPTHDAQTADPLAEEAVADDDDSSDLAPLAPLQRTLYLVDRQASLSVDNQRYLVKRGDETVLSLPATHVDQIMVFGQTPVSNASLQLAARHHCPVAFLSWFGRCYGRFEPAGSQAMPLLMAQFASQAQPGFGLTIVRELLAAKLNHSALILKRGQRHHKSAASVDHSITRLRELERGLKTSASIDSLRGSEGGAAALYWKAFAELIPAPWQMPRRQAHPAPDPINALLSLGYSILYNSVAGLLQARGIHAALGYLHVAGGDHQALASDLMESYRAYVVDATLLHLLHARQLDPGDHRQQAGRCLLGPDTTRTFIRALENRFNTVQQHPQDTERMDLRRVIDRDILLLVAALRSGDASHFIPTRWR